MKKVLLLTSTLLLLLAGAMFVAGCSSDDEETHNDTSLIGSSWKLYGFGSTNNNEIRKAQPDDRDFSYIIHFQEDGAVSGTTSDNEFSGEYYVEGATISIKNVGSTKMGEIGDGHEYFSALLSCSQYFVSNNRLILYYNNNLNYLLFNRQ